MKWTLNHGLLYKNAEAGYSPPSAIHPLITELI